MLKIVTLLMIATFHDNIGVIRCARKRHTGLMIRNHVGGGDGQRHI